MTIKLLLAVFILCTFGSQNVFGQIGMGPLNIKLVKTTQCAVDKDYVKIDVVNIDGQQGFAFDADLPFPLDNTISYAVSVDKVQNGQIQKGVFKHGGSYACEDMKKFLGDFWSKLLDSLSIPNTCPIAAGTYKVDNLPFYEKDFSVKTFLYGRFLMNIEVTKDKKDKIGCIVVEFTNSRPGESV